MDQAVPQKSVIARLLEAVFPELCLGCGQRIAQRLFFCATCAEKGILKKAGQPAQQGEWQRRFAFSYEGNGKYLFQAAKFSDRRRATAFLIRESREELAKLSEGSTVVLALPSQRKFLHRLLRATIPRQKLVPDAFRVKRRFFSNDANKLLGEAGRYKRIHDSLVWNGKKIPEAGHYVLCDDVSTTGATLNHAANLLHTKLGVEKKRILLWALMFRPREFAGPTF